MKKEKIEMILFSLVDLRNDYAENAEQLHMIDDRIDEAYGLMDEIDSLNSRQYKSIFEMNFEEYLNELDENIKELKRILKEDKEEKEEEEFRLAVNVLNRFNIIYKKRGSVVSFEGDENVFSDDGNIRVKEIEEVEDAIKIVVEYYKKKEENKNQINHERKDRIQDKVDDVMDMKKRIKEHFYGVDDYDEYDDEHDYSYDYGEYGEYDDCYDCEYDDDYYDYYEYDECDERPLFDGDFDELVENMNEFTDAVKISDSGLEIVDLSDDDSEHKITLDDIYGVNKSIVLTDKQLKQLLDIFNDD